MIDVIPYLTRPVFHRGDIVGWGEGNGTCPACGGEFYANGVIGEKREVYHCKGMVQYRMVKCQTECNPGDTASSYVQPPSPSSSSSSPLE